MVRLRLFSLFVLVLTACTGQPVAIAPDVVHARAHNGGSIVEFSQDGELLASGGWEGRVFIWRLPGGEPAYRWQAHQDSVNGVAFTDNNTHVVTAGYDGLLAEWTLGGVALRHVMTPSPITCMAASNRVDRLITGHGDGSVRIWRLHDLSLLEERKLHRGKVKAVALEATGGRNASSGADGDVYVWTDDTRALPLERPPTDAWSLVFSPDGRWLYGGGWFRLFRWNPNDGAFVSLPTEHHGIIKAIRFVAGGGELATISRQTDSAVLFLDPVTGAVTRRFQQHELCGASIAVSPRGRYLATTSDDASVRIWVLNRQGETGAHYCSSLSLFPPQRRTTAWRGSCSPGRILPGNVSSGCGSCETGTRCEYLPVRSATAWPRPASRPVPGLTFSLLSTVPVSQDPQPTRQLQAWAG